MIKNNSWHHLAVFASAVFWFIPVPFMLVAGMYCWSLIAFVNFLLSLFWYLFTKAKDPE